VLAVALVCLFTALETVWLRQHHAQWGVHIAAVRGVAYGTPHWRMCQCRLLGPMLVRGAAALTGQSFERCYAPVFFLLLLGANVATFVFFLRASGSGAAAVLCWLASVGLLFVMQDVFWLYLWDIIELSVMLGLVALIHFRAGTWPLVLLWVVALLNRDSWRYVPMWMLLAAGTLWLKQQKQEAIKRALAALVCFVAGQLWVAFITARLFRMETMQVPETRQRIGDLLVELPWNLTKLREGSGWMFVWVSVAMAAGLWLARRRLEERFVPLCLLLAACLVATLCFSRIAETRVFIQYIPFLVWLGWLGVQREQNQANRPGSLELR
jgi:hypothetical protein